MGYASWSVVFGEQPSAAKWNILGTNDSSFNDGTGIGAGVLTGDKLASANKQFITFTPGGATQSDATGAYTTWVTLSAALSVPSWATRAEVDVCINSWYGSTAASAASIQIKIGSDTGSQFTWQNDDTSAAVRGRNSNLTDLVTLTGTGTKTILLQAKRTSGTGTFTLDTGSFITCLVKFYTA
jgi:hypothetical protein